MAEIFWSGRRDSNPRPQPWQGCALPLSYTRIRGTTPGRVVGAICRKRSDIATGLRRSFLQNCPAASLRRFFRRWLGKYAEAVAKCAEARHFTANQIETGRRNAAGGTHSFSSQRRRRRKFRRLHRRDLAGLSRRGHGRIAAPSGSRRFLGAGVRSLQAIDPRARKNRQGGAGKNPSRKDEYR